MKINFKVMGFEDVKWVHLTEDRVQWRTVVNTVMNLRVS
jgi:hypothetical protein